jgi:hypothetical protein
VPGDNSSLSAQPYVLRRLNCVSAVPKGSTQLAGLIIEDWGSGHVNSRA